MIFDKEPFRDLNILNLKENPFKIKQREQKSKLDSEKKLANEESKKSVKINTDNKNDNSINRTNSISYIDNPNYSDSGYGARKMIQYDINDITMDFLKSDQTSHKISLIDIESSKIPELLYFYLEIGQFFNKQSKFMKKIKMFSQTIGLSRIIMDDFKRQIYLEKTEAINDIMELQDVLVSEINKEAELLDNNYNKNIEKKNQDILDKRLNSNFAKKGINGLNNALELKIQANSNNKIYLKNFLKTQ